MCDKQSSILEQPSEQAPAPSLVPPKRHLVHDQIEEFPGSRGQDIRVRIRVWRGKDATPVVLVSQVKGHAHPRVLATRVANYIQEAILRYPDTGFFYFEDGEVMGNPYLAQQLFEYFGNTHRLRLFKPEARPKDWAYLEHVLRGPIER